MWAQITAFFAGLKAVNTFIATVKSVINSIKAYLFQRSVDKQKKVDGVIADQGIIIQSDKEKPIDQQSNEAIKKAIASEEGVIENAPDFPMPKMKPLPMRRGFEIGKKLPIPKPKVKAKKRK